MKFDKDFLSGLFQTAGDKTIKARLTPNLQKLNFIQTQHLIKILKGALNFAISTVNLNLRK